MGLLVGMVVLSGCKTAEMVRRPGGPVSAYAPIDEDTTGEVKYLNAAGGGPAFVADRREDAYRQMFEACAGAYRIVAESDGADFDAASAVLVGQAAQFRHIRFKCEKPGVAP